ncbi:MAG: hypothetical protein ACPGJE_04895, partial [Wenzhouxiangellaceae bacterium]
MAPSEEKGGADSSFAVGSTATASPVSPLPIFFFLFSSSYFLFIRDDITACISEPRSRLHTRSRPPKMSNKLNEQALEYHRYPVPGKIKITPTKALTTQKDLALAYSPGVAAASIQEMMPNPMRGQASALYLF